MITISFLSPSAPRSSAIDFSRLHAVSRFICKWFQRHLLLLVSSSSLRFAVSLPNCFFPFCFEAYRTFVVLCFLCHKEKAHECEWLLVWVTTMYVLLFGVSHESHITIEFVTKGWRQHGNNPLPISAFAATKIHKKRLCNERHHRQMTVIIFLRTIAISFALISSGKA